MYSRSGPQSCEGGFGVECSREGRRREGTREILVLQGAREVWRAAGCRLTSCLQARVTSCVRAPWTRQRLPSKVTAKQMEGPPPPLTYPPPPPPPPAHNYPAGGSKRQTHEHTFHCHYKEVSLSGVNYLASSLSCVLWCANCRGC